MSSAHGFRNAIVLNNIGVTFLERRNYRLAAETFADAVQVMRYVVRSESECVSDHNELTLQSKLARATQRVANPEIFGNRNLFIKVHSYDDEDITGFKSAVEYGPTPEIVFPFRVRSCDTLDSNDCNDLYSAIILRNYGLALLCLARSSGANTAKSTMQIQKAMRINSLAQSLLRSRISAQSKNGGITDIRLLLLCALLMNDDALILQGACKFAEASILHCRVANLCKLVQRLDCLEGFGVTSNIRAAAAA